MTAGLRCRRIVARIHCHHRPIRLRAGLNHKDETMPRPDPALGVTGGGGRGGDDGNKFPFGVEVQAALEGDGHVFVASAHGGATAT